MLALNMLLRFCPEVTAILPGANDRFVRECQAIGTAIRGDPQLVTIAAQDPASDEFDAVLNVGSGSPRDDTWVTVNSTGWLARLAPNGGELPWDPGKRNALGALAAACLGVGTVSMKLLKVSTVKEPLELSLWDSTVGPVGTIDSGPELPGERLDLNAALVGCGGVSNGWAYALRRLPVRGLLEAIDPQRLRDENMGSYVLATICRLESPKAEVIRDALGSQIQVACHTEPFEFFRIRVEHGLVHAPPLVINGLDSIPTRHAVQRFWPDALIDLGSGGTTTQLIAHHRSRPGICLLEALKSGDDAIDHASRAAVATGLQAERIRENPTDLITTEDVARAPEQFRATLEAARVRRQLVCGRVTDHHLNEEEYSPDFAPAVPFVSAFAGIAGAAETLKVLLGSGRPLHQQFDFRTMRIRAVDLQCREDCECTRNRG
jgi:hypothetical protein